jgi:glutamyl endopeptidase
LHFTFGESKKGRGISMARQKQQLAGSIGTAEELELNQGSTEYESVGGINLNLSNPDECCGNGVSANESAGTTEYEGVMGREFGAVAASEDAVFNVDALEGSYGPIMVPEVVIGTDDRIRVQATNVYPWRAICSLKITAADGRRFIGTGWFVSARTLITAGHCVFMHEAGGWVRSIEVIPGLNDASRPFGSAVATQFRSVTGWTQSKKRESDYGAIILPENARLGDQTGTFGFAIRNDAFLTSAKLNLSGYPGDKGGNQQWFMAQKATSVSQRVITYDIDTMGGQSGAPVWVLQDGKRYAVGVHTNGHSSGNSATRIESNVYARIDEWRGLGA